VYLDAIHHSPAAHQHDVPLHPRYAPCLSGNASQRGSYTNLHQLQHPRANIKCTIASLKKQCDSALLLQVLTIQRYWQSELGPQRADRAVFMLQAMTTKTAQLPGNFTQLCRSIMCNTIVNVNLIWNTKSTWPGACAAVVACSI